MSTAFASIALLTVIGQGAGEQASPSAANNASLAANKASLERMVADLSEFDLSVALKVPEKLTLSRAPVLRWSNPTRNVEDAAVFVWLRKDRPELIATVMSYHDGKRNLRRAYEFLSLSQDRLNAVRDGVGVWRPEKPGLAWRSVLGAPAPAGTAAQRRRQMYSLAEAFEVTVQADKNRYKLRLLAQPLHRYQSADAGIVDGALFAFVEGTDPELILALETTRDEPGWRFASGRLTRWGIELRHHDKLVSEFPQMTGAGDPSDTYLIPDFGPLDPASKPPSRPRKNP